MNKRFIENPKFIIYPPKSLKLSDPVLVYNNGRNYKIISLDILKKYPVIHDKFYDIKNINEDIKEIESTVSEITIICCPFTFYTSVFFGTYYPTKILYKNSITLINNNKEKLVPIMGTLENHKFIRRSEAKIMILRNAITMFPDCYYFDDTILDLDVKNINDIELQLSYTIEYTSKTFNKKYTAIVGKNKILDIDKNGIEEYLQSKMEKIREKMELLHRVH